MSAVVIDTNVLHVANQNAPQAGPECILRVVERLESVRMNERVCLDATGFILQEYIDQRFHFSGQPGFGDAFFRWLYQNQANLDVCEIVEIHAIGNTGKNFTEFPGDVELAGFDPSDRKFVAVALTSENSPAVLNAVDSDWWYFRDALENAGVDVEFLCPEQFED